MHSVGIIPARGGSKRLPRKNLRLVLGKPLLVWAIEAAVGSRCLGPERLYVSTEDGETAQVARQSGARVIERPSALAEDSVWTEPVIQHAVEVIEAQAGRIHAVAWINACAPELLPADIDTAFEILQNGGRREVIAIDQQGYSTSAVRFMWRETLFQRRLSARFATLTLDYIDIHTEADLRAAEARIRARSSAP